MINIYFKKKKINFFKKYNFFLICILILAFLSYLQTIFKALDNSCDLMWHPSTLFWGHVNHYQYTLDGGILFNDCQYGQYGHLLFIILYPLTLLEWESAKIAWVGVNVFLTFIIPLYICKSNNVSFLKTAIILIIFATSHPTRSTIFLGQNSLMILFFIMLPYLSINKKYPNLSFFLAGFSYLKYSTGYVLFLNLVVEKKIKFLIFSIIPSLMGWLFYSYYTQSNLVSNFFDPFKLIFQGNYIRTSDLYSILNLYVFEENNYLNKLAILTIVLLMNIYFLFKIKNFKDNLFKLSIICLMTLVFMPHSKYEYILLLPLMIHSICNLKDKINIFNFSFIIYYFYFNRIIRHWVHYEHVYDFLIFIIFFFILFLNIFHKKNILNMKTHVYKRTRSI
jgi:hypothetical protein